MEIAIPREVRTGEHRVALTPSGVQALVQRGHRVWVETGAGVAAGHSDEAYETAGARIAFARHECFARGELLVAVYAPEPGEYELLRPGQVVFAFWALAAGRPEQIHDLVRREVTAVGFEAMERDNGNAPVLTAMSEIAGGLAPILGASLLTNAYGGKGILIGGAPGVPPAHLVVLGAGVLGTEAARTALGLGAQVTLLDSNLEQLREASHRLGHRATTMASTAPSIEKALGFADLVLGAAAVHGERAPLLVPRALLRRMRPRSVVMDLSIDMGGCFETSRPTHFPNPTYEVDGILHFCVPNLPAVAARSATLALTNALLPYLTVVADAGFERAIAERPAIARGTYLHRGRCASEALARTFSLPFEPLRSPAPRGEKREGG